jgi:putative sigma-54 modulation protein
MIKLEVVGRHMNITPALREFAEEKLQKIEKLLGDLDVHVVLGIEKHRHVAEIKIKSRTALLSGMQETGDLYASIGEVVDKLERQALKHKEKLHDHKHRKSPRDPEVAAVIAENASPELAPPAPEAASQVIPSSSFSRKPLSAEDAIFELESTGEEVLVYRDSQSERINVVYKRRDGNFGLVDPDL